MSLAESTAIASIDTASDPHRRQALEIAAFEACMLVRCTGTWDRDAQRGSRKGLARIASGPLAEFSRSSAADRLAELLQAIGRLASVHRYTAGNRHRYEISQVFTEFGTLGLLERTWQQGYVEICGRPHGLRLPHRPRQARHARLLSEAAWRAMLLVCGPTRANAPGLRVADLDTATLLVRAGRTLRMPVRMTTRPGGQLLLVVPGGARSGAAGEGS
ncbi:hypothetical protein [Dactylosporangium sp. CA-233914]|uniref:hypothetical protein n=1 Tax=Dactylosporangium sp. CA-233914 TaxID=3239934 RepID=UPI003D8F7158